MLQKASFFGKYFLFFRNGLEYKLDSWLPATRADIPLWKIKYMQLYLCILFIKVFEKACFNSHCRVSILLGFEENTSS